MGKSGGSAPPPPNPEKTARAEAQYNRLDTYSPSGSGVRHGYTDESGNFVQGTPPPRSNYQSAQSYQESDYERQIREMLQPASVDLTERIISDNVDGLPDAARVQDRGDVGQDIFDRAFSMMAPGIEMSNRRLIKNLQARGLPVGGEAFNEAYGEQQRQTQDTIARLAMDADIAAGQEQSRLYGLDAAERGNALNEILGALSGNYNPPTNMPSGSATPINYSGMVSDQYNAQMQQYQAKQQQAASTAGAIGSLGAALIKSTQTAKTVHGGLNGEWAAGVMQAMPLSIWQYTPDQAPAGDTAPHLGPMAEDFKKMTGLGDGQTINVIDYLGLMAGALKHALHRIEILERNASGEEVH